MHHKLTNISALHLHENDKKKHPLGKLICTTWWRGAKSSTSCQGYTVHRHLCFNIRSIPFTANQLWYVGYALDLLTYSGFKSRRIAFRFAMVIISLSITIHDLLSLYSIHYSRTTVFYYTRLIRDFCSCANYVNFQKVSKLKCCWEFKLCRSEESDHSNICYFFTVFILPFTRMHETSCLHAVAGHSERFWGGVHGWE